MDRQSTIGFILIFVVLVVWMWLNSPVQKPKPVQPSQKTEQMKDTVKTVPQAAPAAKGPNDANPYGKFFSDRAKGNERIISIETDFYSAEVSTKGGVLKKWELKKYKTWDGHPVQLVDYTKNGDFAVLLTTSDGRVVNTKDLYFDVQSSSNNVRVEGNFEFEIKFILPASNGGQLVKKMKFRNEEYGFDAEIQLLNLGPVIANYQYEVAWEHGIRYAEHNSVDESGFAAAYAYAGNELTEIDATKNDQKEQKEFSGSIDWVATRNKYFAVALIPTGVVSDGAYLEGARTAMKDNGEMESYGVSLKMPFKGGASEQTSFKVFLGPLQHSILKSYNKGLENIMSLGWAWLIRPISEYIMLPIFTAIHYVVPNWGLVIIIFSILIKIAMHPLSKSQMSSMKKMQKLQPLMEELRTKYKDDPQKMNQSIMNLYKEYGVNPAGGCLPLLLQMPIMYALYSVFRGAIELRQAGFIGWITDLSIPDVIYRLPFQLPFLGIQDISGIAVLMGVTMFFQTKMTTKDPRQKAMVWMMPIMMTFLFNGFPSGLNLYYTVFNILSIGQQLMINKQHDDEPLRKVEQKKKTRGGIFKFAKDLPRLKK
ncbi:MAG: membrane protein insertase YidC [Ignavibacteriae bacterium]|nr:MAG: membrane protein insertase YidC [Ignavibacteriota bacterium]